MHKLNFYPLGNADSCLIELESGKMLLFDYANLRDPENESDLRIDLSAELHNTLEAAKRDYLDVVAITHGDDDHIHGATQFFHLDHAEKYQGEGRIKIQELWVPDGTDFGGRSGRRVPDPPRRSTLPINSR